MLEHAWGWIITLSVHAQNWRWVCLPTQILEAWPSYFQMTKSLVFKSEKATIGSRWSLFPMLLLSILGTKFRWILSLSLSECVNNYPCKECLAKNSWCMHLSHGGAYQVEVLIFFSFILRRIFGCMWPFQCFCTHMISFNVRFVYFGKVY